MGAYCHRLNAPLIPGGYFEDMDILFSNPMAVDTEPQNVSEATEAALAEVRGETMQWERDMECDGSGLYDPDHPDMANLVAQYGKVVFQITVIRPDGLFAKGIIVPRDGLNNGMDTTYAIHLDMAQVKGAFKGKIGEEQVEKGCFVGLMKSWDRLSYFPGSFELLEFIRIPKDAGEKKELGDAVRSLVSEAVDEIFKNGVDGLMSEVSKDDDNLRLVVKIIAQLRANGMKLNPMSVPMIRSAIEDKLRAKLWIIAQGAGIRGRQYVTVLDATVPEGRVVCGGFKYGTQVAIWRFPCVLAQGLVTSEVIAPRPHHLVEGKIIPNTVFMNPRDLTGRMQGDDDGDIVGISNDPRILTCFKYRQNTDVYMIEPVGQKFSVGTNQEEGHKYLETDPRGPVGLTTIWQAQLLACGDWYGALAMAVLNQEAIDCMKRKIRWTDVTKACEPSMWSEDSNGNLVLNEDAKLDVGMYENDPNQPAGWPGEYLRGWVTERLGKFGCIRNRKVRMEPLAWRIQTEYVDNKEIRLSKRINPSNWVSCAEKARGFAGGNLVHWCHDVARWAWGTHAREIENLLGSSEIPCEARDLLFQLMAQKGMTVGLTCESWETYVALREKGGITEYGQAFKRLLGKRVEDEVKFGAIERLNKDLSFNLAKLSVAELLTIWYWELTPTYRVDVGGEPTFTHEPEGRTLYMANKANYAFRAISFPGSPILPLLGIEDNMGCPFLGTNDRVTKIIEWAMAQPNPFTSLSSWVFKDLKHGEEIKGEGGARVELHQCQHCLDTATTGVIRTWRARKTAGEVEFMRTLVSELNQVDRIVREDTEFNEPEMLQ